MNQKPADEHEPREMPSIAFWRYLAAAGTSTIGAGVTTVALPLLAITILDASNFEASLLTAASYGAVVLIGLPAGVIVQRFGLRNLQVAMDVFRAGVVLTIPLAAWLDILTFHQLLLVAFFVGLAGNLFDVANVTFLPQIVSNNELISRNGIVSGTHATTNTAGPALGGILVQTFGAATSIVTNAVTYLISAILLWGIPAKGQPGGTDDAGLIQQVTEGIRYTFRHPVIRPAAIAATTINFANGAILAAMTPFLLRTLNLPAGLVGVVIATDSLGTVIGAALTARLSLRFGDAKAIILSTTAGAAFALAMPLASDAWAVVIFALGLGFFAAGVAVFSVVSRTHRQTVSPPELLSRVMASVRFVSWSAIPLGALSAGTLAEAIGPRAGLLVGCAAGIVSAMVLWCSRIRRLRNLVDDEPLIERSR